MDQALIMLGDEISELSDLQILFSRLSLSLKVVTTKLRPETPVHKLSHSAMHRKGSNFRTVRTSIRFPADQDVSYRSIESQTCSINEKGPKTA